MSEIKFLLWSNKHQAWWRPDSRGYTTEQADAGRYTQAEALEKVLASSFCGSGYMAAPFLDADRSNATEQVLTALADAGLLVQPGGETREEWAYPVERDGETVWIPTWIRDHRHLGGEIWVHRRTVTVWPDGTELLTPWWREVPDA